MAGRLGCLATLLVSGWAVLAAAEPITISGTRSNVRGDGEIWRPLREGSKTQLRLPPPTSAYYMDMGHKKHFQLEPIPSNKVEVYAAAPPSILGSFSGFGHETLKTRHAHPAKHVKKPYKDSFQLAESRPGYPSELLAPPQRHVYPQPFKQSDSLGQAYYFEASLSPPPRESAINFVPPPSSKNLAPNSYYLQFDQQTRPKPSSSPSFSPYLRQSLPLYGTPDHYKTSSSIDPYRFYSPEPPKIQINNINNRPTNSHGRPPGIDYFGNNPFGDIHLNTARPETKTPAKDVFEQLSPLGRPFQSSTIEPPSRFSSPSDFSSVNPDFFSTSDNFQRQTTPKPFRPSPLIVDTFPSTERPQFITPGPSAPPSREVFPIPVTTLDIPSREEYFNKPTHQVTYQSVPETQQYREEVTNKPITTTFFGRHEINTEKESFYQPTPFLPTPATDQGPSEGEPAPTELISPSPETNEVHKPTRTRVTRPRYRKKKPQRKPEQFVETTTEYNFETPANDYSVNDERLKLTTFDTLQNNYQTTQDQALESEPVRYEEKPKRKRPVRPNHFQTTSTFTNTEPDIQEVPTAFSTMPDDDVNTFPPSSTTTEFTKFQQRRRKKPTNHRGSTRHGLTRSTTTTTTTTTEPVQELTSEDFPRTEYQTVRDTQPTENYPLSGLSFDEYGHVVQVGTDEYSVNTLYPTQHQVDDYQTNQHEVITTTTTEAATTTTSTTTTPVPETTTPSTTTAKSRSRNKYNYNKTRPRFSVKDYRERLNKATSTTTEAPKEEPEEQNDVPRIRPPRLRGNVSYKQTETPDEQVETSTRKFKPRYTSNQRHAYRTSTTQSPLEQLDTPTTERQNSFRPSVQRRPGSNKYYSRYRTSTETPESAEQPEVAKEKLPQRPKGVFSAKKRRPFPLRTRVEATTLPNEDDSPSENFNDLEHDQYITKKSDNMATTTLMTSSEETEYSAASSIRPDVYTPTDPLDHVDISQKIADLTSSPSNSFDASGFFKGVSPSSRRTVASITLATDDPILPIEAFFSSSFNRNDDSR